VAVKPGTKDALTRDVIGDVPFCLCGVMILLGIENKPVDKQRLDEWRIAYAPYTCLVFGRVG